MIDPLSAFAIIKSGISAGKQLHSMGKDIASFFDAVDGAKAQLKELITQTRGYSQYQALLNLRREIRVERKEKARQASIEAEERKQVIISGILIIVFIGSVILSSVFYLWYLGWINF